MFQVFAPPNQVRDFKTIGLFCWRRRKIKDQLVHEFNCMKFYMQRLPITHTFMPVTCTSALQSFMSTFCQELAVVTQDIKQKLRNNFAFSLP